MNEEERRTEYDAYLASPAWQLLRTAALERDGHACRICNATRKLDVHHRTYERFGNEDLNDLTVLCRPCHEKHHGRSFDNVVRLRPKKAKKKRSPNHGLAAQPAEREAALALMADGKRYRTEQVANALGWPVQRAGTVLAALRKAKQVTREKKHGKHWQLSAITPTGPLSKRSVSRVKPRRLPQVDAA